MAVAVKRVYEPASPSDGVRVLVDRLWPQGLTKVQTALDDWLRGVAPSDELRKWFHSQPQRWLQFRRRYLKELANPEAEIDLRKLYALAHKRKRLTLLFASKDRIHNNAVVLKDLIGGMKKPPSGTGARSLRQPRLREAAVLRR